MSTPEHVADEIQYAKKLCKSVYGLEPNIGVSYLPKYVYDSMGSAIGYDPLENEVRWTITCFENYPDGCSLHINIGPYESLLQCVCAWNTEMDRIRKDPKEVIGPKPQSLPADYQDFLYID